MSSPFSALFVLLIILFQAGNGQQIRLIETSEVVLLFEGPLRSAAKELTDIYPGVKKELEEIFRWKLNFRPTILLLNNKDSFHRIAGSDLIVAVAIPQRNIIVIDYPKMRTRPFAIRTTLKHELSHLLLHHYIKRTNLPKWLDEGISQWVSEGIAEIIIDGKRSFLNEAILSNRYLTLDELTARFPEDTNSLLLAYEQSKSFVDYISNTFGRNAILNILNHLRDGYGVDEAVLKGLSIPLDELEQTWHSHLRTSNTWITYISTNLYQFLFFITALITIYGFIRFVIKKRGYTDEDEETFLSFD
ncbi:MAG: peptidase MA family metallohydrolase [Thermodesulfobacteriota bacterium]|nr:peptidase MA family metallohydrolase [Thermodesulfobacteriota bacterium]